MPTRPSSNAASVPAADSSQVGGLYGRCTGNPGRRRSPGALSRADRLEAIRRWDAAVVEMGIRQEVP